MAEMVARPTSTETIMIIFHSLSLIAMVVATGENSQTARGSMAERWRQALERTGSKDCHICEQRQRVMVGAGGCAVDGESWITRPWVGRIIEYRRAANTMGARHCLTWDARELVCCRHDISALVWHFQYKPMLDVVGCRMSAPPNKVWSYRFWSRTRR